MIDLNYNISSIKILGENYNCVIQSDLFDMFRTKNIDYKLLCFLILEKKCKFYNDNNFNEADKLEEFRHVVEIPVNNFEKIEIIVYTILVNQINCFNFQTIKDWFHSRSLEDRQQPSKLLNAGSIPAESN